MKAHISFQIDQLANQSCRLMTSEERQKFFASSSIRTTYLKGMNRGKERKVFEVSGEIFNKLWKLVEPYVFVSALKSNYYRNTPEMHDNVSEIKFLLFRYLRFFGPQYSGKPFSTYLPLLVNNVLTNEANKRFRSVLTTSLFIEIDGEEIVNPEVLREEAVIKDFSRDIEIVCDLCDEDRQVITLLLSNMTLAQVARERGQSVFTLKNRLQKYFTYLQSGV